MRDHNDAGELRVLSEKELAAIPPVEWLVAEMLPLGCLAVLYGLPATYKSFLAIDIALSISAGISWQDRCTAHGHILYQLGEGLAGLSARVAAWKEHQGLEDVPQSWFIPERANLSTPRGIDQIARAIGRLPDPPKLLAIDTLARAIPGVEENMQQGMGLVVDGVDRLREEFGCAALLVHHARKDGTAIRGSSVLEGAADVVMEMHREQPLNAVLQNVKQKDGPAFSPIRISLKERNGTLVVASVAAVGQSARLTNSARVALVALRGEAMLTYSEWARRSGLSEGSFNKLPKKLLIEGLVSALEVGGRHQYHLTPEGKVAISDPTTTDTEPVATG